MANIKSQIKRNRQNEKRRLRNRNFRGSARTALKDAHTTLATGTDDSKVSVLAAISALDRAAQKGAIHARNAARRKSRLMKQLNAAAMAGFSTGPATDKKAEKKTAAKPATKKIAQKKTAATAKGTGTKK